MSISVIVILLASNYYLTCRAEPHDACLQMAHRRKKKAWMQKTVDKTAQSVKVYVYKKENKQEWRVNAGKVNACDKKEIAMYSTSSFAWTQSKQKFFIAPFFWRLAQGQSFAENNFEGIIGINTDISNRVGFIVRFPPQCLKQHWLKW